MGLDYNISIIANTKGRAWDFAVKIYNYVRDKAGRDKDKIELNPLHIHYFRNGEFKPRISKNVRRRNCVFIHDSNLEPSVWANQLSLVNQALRYSSPHEIINVLPNFLWGRQDVKDESRVPISAKDILNRMNYDHTRVLTVEAHNEAIQGYVDIPCDILPAFPVFFRHLQRNHSEILHELVFGGPDSGCLKRNRRYTKKIGMNAVQVDKDRKITGELGESLGVLGADLVRGKNVLLYDDMWDSGNSLKNGAIALRNAGAKKVFGAVPHGLCLEGIDKIANHFDLFFIGNTINLPLIPGEGVYMNSYTRQTLPKEIYKKLPKSRPVFFSDILKQSPYYANFKLPPNIEIFSLEEIIGEAVFRNCVGESLSALFNLSPENSTLN